MTISVTAWDIYNAFNDPNRAEAAFQRIAEIDFGVGIYDEAYDIVAPQEEELVESTIQRFENIGYQALHLSRVLWHGIMAISRPPVEMSLV